jgi:glycosyltransferase involved in cell wall biosynthesis
LVRETLGRAYSIEFVLVDDCSADETWAKMNETFGGQSGFHLVRHEVNQGVAKAILTGIKAAETEIVCSMDADCTYDPLQLEKLIPLLSDDVAMVTASPYHPEGKVVGVPEWRLFLSRNLSKLYGMVLHHKFKTYTSCFRAYRKSIVADVELQNGGFLGVAEMLVLLDLEGHKLAECPATLEARLLGASKLKTLRTVRDHLKLLASIPSMKRSSRHLPPAKRTCGQGRKSHLEG